MLPSRIAEELKLAHLPVAIIFTNDKPEGALEQERGKWGCVIALLTEAAKGKTAVLSRDTCGCSGGRVGLGFGSRSYDEMRGGIEYFLSTGRGEGYPEGEGYRKTPELARAFIDALPATDIPFTYVVFKPLKEVDPEKETPQVVIFYANPDQLAALVVLANYDRGAGDNAIIPHAAGCHSIGIIPYQEAKREKPRAVVGMTDISARPHVSPEVMSFTVPFSRFLEMEANVEGSFLQKKAWQKLRERIPEPHMDTFEAIAERRSIRKFQNKPVPRELIERILEATVQAPSGNNSQPWRFVVVAGKKRSEMVRVMREAIRKCKENGVPLGSSEASANCMEQAPVTIFVFNGEYVGDRREKDWCVVDVQSIGGAIQTMLLAAQSLGLGTLWICDVFYAYDELREWLGRKDQMIAAVAIGYADEAPPARPRRPWQEVTSWVEE